MEHQGRGVGGVSEGRFIRLPGGKKTPVYTDTGGKLGTVEWFAIDPLDGRIALVMIVSRRLGLFAPKRLALPWNALSVEPDTGRLVVRTEDGLDQGLGARSAPALRRDPSRVEPL
jgi:hypothetical protein